mmetsp:Transcript_2193/g.4474  ORF Transcript_2193/g.4474 Transcript_2193/m.4474 type:complete len:336 (-) Transcript_2193:4197-5204(-)
MPAEFHQETSVISRGHVGIEGELLGLDADWGGAVISSPARHLSVPVGLPENWPTSSLVPIIEGVRPLHALTNVGGNAGSKIVALLGTDSLRAIIPGPALLARAGVRERAVTVVFACLRAHRNRAVISRPALGALASVRSDARSVIVTAPNHLVHTLPPFLEPPPKGVGLHVIVRYPRPEGVVSVLDENVSWYLNIQHVVQIDWFIDIILSVRAGSIEFYNARTLHPTRTSKTPVPVSSIPLIGVRIEHLLVVKINHLDLDSILNENPIELKRALIRFELPTFKLKHGRLFVDRRPFHSLPECVCPIVPFHFFVHITRKVIWVLKDCPVSPFPLRY